MKTNTQFTVSVQMLILISISGGRKITSSMISDSTGCNPVMVRQLFGKLKNAGILNITAGKGTTTLAREASDITLWDVFAAVEGNRREEMFAFHPDISKSCKVGRSFECVLGDHLDEGLAALRDSFGRVTIAQLVEETAADAARRDSGNPVP